MLQERKSQDMWQGSTGPANKKNKCYVQMLMPYKYFIQFRRKPAFYITCVGGRSTWRTYAKLFFQW